MINKDQATELRSLIEDAAFLRGEYLTEVGRRSSSLASRTDAHGRSHAAELALDAYLTGITEPGPHGGQVA